MAHRRPQYLKLYCVELYLKLSCEIEQLEKKSGYGLFCFYTHSLTTNVNLQMRRLGDREADLCGVRDSLLLWLYSFCT